MHRGKQGSRKGMEKAFEETQPNCKAEVNELIDQVNHAKNSMCRKHGYAPYQHVFGCDLRLPGSVEDVLGVPHNSAVYNGVDSVIRSHELRQAARRAFVAIDEDDKVRRAIDRRSRPPRGPFDFGDYVYYWRKYPRDGAHGRWHGPGVIIGKHGDSRLWVAVGTKVLKCAPEQLRRTTADQEAAIRMVSEDLVNKKRGSQGAQVYTDISNEAFPPADMDEQDDNDHEGDIERSRKRSREADVEAEQDEFAGYEPSPNEIAIPEDDDMDGSEGETQIPESTAMDVNEQSSRRASSAVLGDEGRPPTSATATAKPSRPSAAIGEYGPQRREHGNARYEEVPARVPSELQKALNRSVEMLDVGNTRLHRTPLEIPVGDDEAEDALEAFLVDKGLSLDVYLAQKSRTEVKLKDMTAKELVQKEKGMVKEWDKLVNTKSIKVHVGDEARRLRSTIDPKNMLESRFVYTRRELPEDPQQTEIKSRWCIKGYKDPAILEVERQSPTLSADALSVVLQVIASKKWRLTVADIEGAFLQGHGMKRPGGKVYVKLPPEGVPGVEQDVVVEVCKYVYGLAEAPRQWWLCLSGELEKLGMRRSVLDPCCFYWHHQGQLQGIIAFHVDDLIMGGSQAFHETVLGALRARFPFKHWVQGEAKFLGRRLRQREDFSIVCDQEEYASQVRSVHISKERRRLKDDRLTSKELTLFRGILGAANWLVSSSRPDIAVLNAVLQQRVSKATVADLIEANKLVGVIRDHATMSVTYHSIPLESGLFLLATDASWANTGDLRSQAGHVIMFGDASLEQEIWAKVSPLRWRSFKLDRHTQSTLGSELMSLARGIAECDWLRSLMAEAVNPEYSLEADKKCREAFRAVVTVDNKPIYDHTNGDGIIVRDKRMAIDMLLVRRDIRESNMVLRWVETKQMIADPLTKVGADPSFLRFIFKQGEYVLVKEDRSLQWRVRERELKKGAKEKRLAGLKWGV